MPHRDDDTVNAADWAEFRPEWSAAGHLSEESIYAWLDGAFDAADSDKIQQHVAGCAECGAIVADARGYIAGAARIVGALDAAPRNVVPGSDVAHTAARIVAMADARAGSATRPWHTRSVFRAAAAFVVLFGGATYVVTASRFNNPKASSANSSALAEVPANSPVARGVPERSAPLAESKTLARVASSPPQRAPDVHSRAYSTRQRAELLRNLNKQHRSRRCRPVRNYVHRLHSQGGTIARLLYQHLLSPLRRAGLLPVLQIA